MSLPELPNTRNPRELRKALLRLRMEMHRQQISHESTQMLEPVAACAAWAARSARAWGQARLAVGPGRCRRAGFLTGKGVRSGNMTRLLRLGTSLVPLIRLFLSSGRRP
jgi:hypothetical protein